MKPSNGPRPPADPRRHRARRTALWVAVVAVLVYVGFIALAAWSR